MNKMNRENCKCDWRHIIPCNYQQLKPLKCTVNGCNKLVHHLCQIAFEQREGCDEIMALKCCLHHPQSPMRASKPPPVNDHEENLNLSTASNSKTSMANSSGHRNDAGINAAGTDASSFTTSHSSTSTGSLYPAERPLRNVNIDPSYALVIKEQDQKIKYLQQQLAEFNRVKYRTLSGNASRGKNVVRTTRKISMTPTDQINQQVVASYLREAIWPSNKILPNKWSKWREDRNSLCQMILRKVAIPVGVDGQSYWEAMILGITNDKFCALRANFKQELFEQFQGKYTYDLY